MMLGMVLMISPAVAADSLPPALQAKVEQYKKKMAEWAADPAIVAAVKEANARGSLAGMSNSKWLEVDEKSPTSQAFTTSKAGLIIKKWEEDKQINKLVVRDEKGNLVAASTKPLLYNNAIRPVYINAMKGEPWAAGNIAPDPTTQVKSVQASAPIMDGGKVIGVVHAGITTE
ncbi:PDC sensor domain-containing protein [Noviherbaspirillum sp.]|jgi:hypothetical protein|uniref:PDC sensor domain-containing protein n=1 Tax=Noviherbaspirillum sp. TaxID=1926288 RepID=UPI002DDCDE81|nr:PDC sensor domain-containing protein [Noviherbaspirillum sp.]